jgi:hypothetical protein
LQEDESNGVPAVNATVIKAMIHFIIERIFRFGVFIVHHICGVIGIKGNVTDAMMNFSMANQSI